MRLDNMETSRLTVVQTVKQAHTPRQVQGRAFCAVLESIMMSPLLHIVTGAQLNILLSRARLSVHNVKQAKLPNRRQLLPRGTVHVRSVNLEKWPMRNKDSVNLVAAANIHRNFHSLVQSALTEKRQQTQEAQHAPHV